MSEAVETSEIQFCREVNGASQVVAITAEKEEVKLFMNPISASNKSGNCAHDEELFVETGEQETREVHGSIDAIDRCTVNGKSLYVHLLFKLSIDTCNIVLKGSIPHF